MRALLLLSFFICGLNVHAQTFAGYFRLNGMPNLCELAHPSNEYLSGDFTVSNQQIDVTLKSRDRVIGTEVTTRLRVVTASELPYFIDIDVLSDDYVFPPFEQLTNEIDILLDLAAQSGEGFQPIRYAFTERFGNDMLHWSGKTWALFMLNLYYYTYSQ